MSGRYYQVKDGEWIRPTGDWNGFLDACCDCGLVHRVTFRLIEGEIHFRATRDNRKTAAMRRSILKLERK